MIYHHPSELNPNLNYAVTIGTFDGLHLGHRKVIDVLKEQADTHRLHTLLVTFENNPKAFVEVSVIPEVLSKEDKMELLEQSGLDAVLSIPFDEEIRRMSQEDFLEFLQVPIKRLIIGHDFRFGYKRDQVHEQSLPVIQVEPVLLDGEVISSTLLRNFLREGDMESMQKALGRAHYYTGHVVPGMKRGKKLGFPTINLTVQNNLYSLKRGVYITQTQIGHTTYHSVSNIGINPTFEDKPFTLETHILDYENDLYGEQVKIMFLHHLRDEMTFETSAQLSQQMASDVEQTRLFFKTR